MTVTLNIGATGVPKRVLLEMAFEACGLAGFDLDRTAEEVVAALRQLNALAKEWPWSVLPYNQPSYSVGLPEEISGVPGDAEAAVADELAKRIAPGLGLTLSAEQRAKGAASRATFLAQYATIPATDMPGGIPLGGGQRRRHRAFTNPA